VEWRGHVLQDSPRYIDEVLQAEDIALVGSVQHGMATPGFTQGRIIYDEGGSGRSEHVVHHFRSLVLDAYEGAER
jgi:choline monooxygenase